MAHSSRLAFLRRRSFLIPLFLVIVVAGGAFILLTRDPITIASVPVRKGPFLVSIKVSGEIRATNSFTLTTPRVRFSQAPVVYLVPEGRTVAAGDTVIRFATTEFDKTIIDRESELDMQQSDYRKLQADQASRMLDLQSQLRTNELAMDQAQLQVEKVKFESEVSRKEAEINNERCKLNLESAKRRILAQERVDHSEDLKAKLRIQQLESDLSKLRSEREQLIMRAPMPGLVVYEMNWQTGRKIAVGDSPWPGMSIVSLPDLSKMQTLSNVNEVDISKVAVGQQATVRLDAFPDRTFDAVVGSVGTIGQIKDRSSNMKTFEVVLDITGRDPILKPGMTTSNEIIMATILQALFVPHEAVFEKDGRMIVYRMEGGIPRPAPVSLGEKNGNFVIITQGLGPSDRVTLRDPSAEQRKTEPASRPAAPKP